MSHTLQLLSFAAVVLLAVGIAFTYFPLVVFSFLVYASFFYLLILLFARSILTSYISVWNKAYTLLIRRIKLF